MAREKCPPDIPGRVHFCLMFIFVIGSVGTTIVMASSWIQYNHANSIYVPAAAIMSPRRGLHDREPAQHVN